MASFIMDGMEMANSPSQETVVGSGAGPSAVATPVGKTGGKLPPSEFSLHDYARNKDWALESRRAVGFTIEILLQTCIFFWIGGFLGSTVDRLSRWLSPMPTPAQRAEGRVNRGLLLRDICITVPLLIVSFTLLRTFLIWMYEKVIFRRLLHRHAPTWFHYQAYRLFGAYAMGSGMGWTSPTTSAKTAALFGI